ncbi:DUF1516 family protein [Salibacterium qingdaonense]|uniref:Uncharacterized protein n=1 Tax=Salibacterium qingdaonense TaxID=266892 RepID=A0A1I4N606_9BACI|nr:DUF1516 family protein [Salibacterium qingdaonense]SFM10756.1 Protein of unknown function [Salibacterium qingdaonense]
MIIHYHLGAVTVVILLFAAVHYLYSRQMNNIALIVHNLLRVLYLAAIMTGFILLGQVSVNVGGLGKLALGIISIGLIEIYFSHYKKDDAPKPFLMVVIIILALTVLTGILLPQGIHL